MTRISLLLLLGLCLPAGAQITPGPVPVPVPTGPPVFHNSPSQANLPQAGLLISGTITESSAGSTTVLGPFSVMGPAALSATLSWQLPQSSTGSATFDMSATIRGLPNSQLTLAVSTTPGPGPVGSSGAWLPGTVSFPNIGDYHLDGLPLPVFDSLGLLGGLSNFPLTDAFGEFPFNVPVPLNGPDHLTLQAITVDPTAPLGIHLTAAFALYKHL